MLKRFLIFWLMLSILGLGMAFANGLHVEDSQTHSHQFILDITANSVDNDDNSNEFSNNCHDGIHLLGLNSVQTVDISTTIHSLNIPYSAEFIPLPPGSLFRPPISF